MRIQRRMAIRVIRGYRTISYDAALTLAGLTPYDLIAKANMEAYHIARDSRTHGTDLSRSIIQHIRGQALIRASKIRRTELETSRAVNKHGVKEILTQWETWQTKGAAFLTYRITQVIRTWLSRKIPASDRRGNSPGMPGMRRHIGQQRTYGRELSTVRNAETEPGR